MSSMMQLSHVQRVRLLFKTCLKLHRGLPIHLKAIGDTYVRDEFKRHKTANDEQVRTFMEAWAKYALTLTRQMGLKGPQTGHSIGEGLQSDAVDLFTGEQLVQLFELYQEASKPITDEDQPRFQ